MPMLVCPSAPNSNRVDILFTPGVPVADYSSPSTGVNPSFYAANGLPQPADYSGATGAMAAWGTAILQGTVCPFRNITDGLTNTILFAECAGRPYLLGLGTAGHACHLQHMDENRELAAGRLRRRPDQADIVNPGTTRRSIPSCRQRPATPGLIRPLRAGKSTAPT